jgi:transposase InsO family protein
MFHLIVLLFKLLLIPFSGEKKETFLIIALQQKEIDTLKRSLSFRHKRLRFSAWVKGFFALLLALSPKLKSAFHIITPDTVLKWYHSLLKSFWRFPSRRNPRGRPPVPPDVKQLILTMKNENLLWGIKRIQGELLKLGISLDKKTISSILRDFRGKGRIKTGLSWRQFIQTHAQSLFACDFFTVDTFFNARFYVFFIIHLATRRIEHISLTRYPSRQFVRQRIIDFSESLTGKAYLIHDRSPELFQDYPSFGIQGAATSVKAPNMNAFAERFVRSVRREALDNFIVVSEKQLRFILERYVLYYNSLRPHQGIGQRVPDGYTPQTTGTIISHSVLDGLHHHYTRKTA